MRKKIILITGAAGEIGHALIESLAGKSGVGIVSIDLQPLPEDVRSLSNHFRATLPIKVSVSPGKRI
jgi:NAD(P)-dependent dehydrogenase (short-subunit alcohol dehydrogenase family)